MLWRIESEGRFYDAGEGSMVYFDPNTGDTHLLTDLAGFVLQQFSPGQPLTQDTLVAHVAPHFDEADQGNLAEIVTAVLQELCFLDILQAE